MRLLDAVFDRKRSGPDRAGDDSMEVRIDFFGKDEVCVLLVIDTCRMQCWEKTAELRLFAWYSLRQFHNLGTNRIVEAFASVLMSAELVRELMKDSPSLPGAYALLTLMRDEAFEEEGLESRYARMSSVSMSDPILDVIDQECLAKIPRITEPSDRRPKKSFIAEAPPFTVHLKGFGPLGRNLNYYAPHSIIALLRYLGRKRASDGTYLDQLSFVASGCAKAYLRKEIARFKRPQMARQIVAAAQEKIPEASSGEMTNEYPDLDTLIQEAYRAGLSARNWALYYGFPLVFPEDDEWSELSETEKLRMSTLVKEMRSWRESSTWLGNIGFSLFLIAASISARIGQSPFDQVCVVGGLLGLLGVAGLSALVSSWYSRRLARRLPRILGALSWPALGVGAIGSAIIYSPWRGIVAAIVWLLANYVVNVGARMVVWKVRAAIHSRARRRARSRDSARGPGSTA